MSPAEDVAASSPAARLPDRDDEQATLEIVIPADWKEGVKLATTLENGQRVIITPPDGAKAGMSRELILTLTLTLALALALTNPDSNPTPNPNRNPNPNPIPNPDPGPDLNTGQVCPSSSTCPPPTCPPLRLRDLPPPLKPPRCHLLYLLLKRPRRSQRRHLRGRRLWWSKGRGRSVWTPSPSPTPQPSHPPLTPDPLPSTSPRRRVRRGRRASSRRSMRRSGCAPNRRLRRW
jgi:hypothetical protein